MAVICHCDVIGDREVIAYIKACGPSTPATVKADRAHLHRAHGASVRVRKRCASCTKPLAACLLKHSQTVQTVPA